VNRARPAFVVTKDRIANKRYLVLEICYLKKEAFLYISMRIGTRGEIRITRENTIGDSILISEFFIH